MNDLHPVDLAVLVLYLIGITALGVWMARWVRGSSDFFMPRRFGKWMMMTHAFGTGTASDQAVLVAGQTFKMGLSGIWWQWLWLPASPFYWLIAPIMRRFRAVTTADVYALRYNGSVAYLFAIVGIIGLAVKIGLMLIGSAALVDSCTGGAISTRTAIGAITVLFVFYGCAGGLGAAIVTDFIQGILTIVFSFLLLPFVMNAVGGLDGIRQTVNDPEMMSLLSPGKIGIFFIVMFGIQALMGIVAQPFIMGVCAAGRTEMDGRVGFMFGNIIKRICTIAWSLTAMAAVAWYMNRGVDLSQIKPDHVYGDIAREFLPRVFPGLLGLFLASLLASVMSSCDSFMISASGLFTENIYKPAVPDRADRHYVWVGRFVAVLVVLGGVYFAYTIPNVKEALKTWFKIAPMMGVAFWLGLFWRRATPAGAWAAALLGFGVWWLTTWGAFVAWLGALPFANTVGFVFEEAGKPPAVYDPWVIVFYTTAAVLGGIIVSLLTRPVADDKLNQFYTLTRTPIADGEVIKEPCTLPEGVVPAQRPMLVTALGLEIPVPSRTSVLGFLAGWVAVAALIGGFLWLVG